MGIDRRVHGFQIHTAHIAEPRIYSGFQIDSARRDRVSVGIRRIRRRGQRLLHGVRNRIHRRADGQVDHAARHCLGRGLETGDA